MTTSTNPVTDNTTDVLSVFKDETGALYVDVQFTTGAGSGPSPLTAAVHVVRIPVQALLV